MDITWKYDDIYGKTKNAFDHVLGTMFHSSNPVVPEQEMMIDMRKAYKLDYFEYIPRMDNKGVGLVFRMDIYTSIDGVHWEKVWDGMEEDAGSYNIGDMSILDEKKVELEGEMARYLKLSVRDSLVGYFSAEIGVYTVEGDKGAIVGDLNNSRTIDDEDLTFYENYVGLKEVDSDWSYVSSLGNFHKNGFIDASDVDDVARQVGRTPVTSVPSHEAGVRGKITLIPSKMDIRAGDTVVVDVYGIDLKNVYAFNIDFAAYLDKATYTSTKATSNTVLMRNYSQYRWYVRKYCTLL